VRVASRPSEALISFTIQAGSRRQPVSDATPAAASYRHRHSCRQEPETPAPVPCRSREVLQQPRGLLCGEDLESGTTAAAWHPYTARLAKAGVPKKIFRAPLLAKLQDAGFATLLDVRCPPPRLHAGLPTGCCLGGASGPGRSG
jgi:hypothetical protein